MNTTGRVEESNSFLKTRPHRVKLTDMQAGSLSITDKEV
jgi:hypothetical protein